ncbi:MULTISPECIES: DUF6232 family protein [Streptomyces]|jgi:hypothetical protein|uniref:Uncharacterized protein n=1 Tax=Streptomyces nymphaeiformis TaxID=2663842 RepID=A0A7W7U0X0_9ACTN|nr:DUF6232 family protein [Streptomyces nymphaeiformis]MBB4982122.1 hypothetical protein [Streptomyces nymphaeiformis]
MGTNETPPPKPTRPPNPASPPSRPWQEPERALASRAASAALPPRQGLVISKRLLWVHGGAYPLENIVRVYTFVLRPRRGEAFFRFLKRGGATIALFLFLLYVSDSSSSSYSSSDAEGFLGIARVLVLALLIYLFADMASVVFARSHYVLAIETNGRSTALVTGERDYLNQLVRSIAEAIDQPDAEFQASVGTLMVSNYGNYFFGDAVNMYGGSGNTGVAK